MNTRTATYDPEDNKLRLYTVGRLDSEDYQRARAVGFRWAPRQELFVCPRWTPEAEDLLLDWCGEIDDEDTSLVQRAEERADRFEEYSEKRNRDGDRADAGVRAIADNIPLGQPILVGHHSEKRARKDAERIENGMRKALKMWDTAAYWLERAAGARAHANYKAQPAVRARRIKKLEADRRRWVRTFTPADDHRVVQRGSGFACRMATPPAHAMDETCPRCEEQEHAWHGKGLGWCPTRTLPARQAYAERWLAHIDNRLAYERALLEEDGETRLLEKKPRRKLPPLRNYRPSIGWIECRSPYRDEAVRFNVREMTAAEWKRKASDYKGTATSWDGSHRVRTAMFFDQSRGSTLAAVFITDKKDHGEPEGAPKPAPAGGLFA